MHYTHDHVPRSFRVPLGPWLIPILGILLCIVLWVFLLMNVSKGTGIRFAILMIIGHIFYFSYGFWHSKAHSPQQGYPNNQIGEIVPADVFTVSYPSKMSPDLEQKDEGFVVMRL
jgi:hypothetical protein